ncbi:TraB family protein [Phycisphaerae bacterium RAS1]|nr:TraB family protein [Phycisphaerae bacterium RAS1]
MLMFTRPSAQRIPALTLLVVLASARTAAAQAVQPTDKPLLWMIEGKTPSYLYGTIHLPDDRVLALPKVVDKALDACDAFFAEIPMDGDVILKSAQRMMLPEGKKLQDVIPKKVYDRAAAFAKTKGFDIAAFSRMRVWAVAVQITLLDRLHDMATKQALDMSLYLRCQAEDKQVGGLETLDEQFGIFESFSDAEQAEMLDKTLDFLEKSEKEGVKYIDKLIDLYLSGDEAELMKFMNAYFDENDPLDKRMVDKLLTQRNKHMAERMAAKLKESPGKSFFFAVGAAHLPDKTGVIELLKQRGLKLRRLTPADAAKLEAK